MNATTIVFCTFVLILISFPAARVQSTVLSLREEAPTVPFYLYDGDTYPSLQPLSSMFSEMELKAECSGAHEGLITGYWVTNAQWHKALSNHSWRTMNPEDAEVFVILFSVDESIAAGTCKGGSHFDRTSKAVQTVISSPWFRRNHGRDHFWPDYISEIQDSKFCLVISCDDPQTSRYADALAAGCVPIIIDSGFRMAAAPFNRLINYDQIMITVPSQVWNEDPAAAVHEIYTLPESRMRPLYDRMIRARKDLLWEHPESMVATHGLTEIKEDCLSPGAPTNFRPED